MRNDEWIREALDGLAAAGEPIVTEQEALAVAARDHGDETAGVIADELAVRAEWGES